MRIEAVVPAVSGQELNCLIDSICHNTIQPDCVHVIDNSQEGLNITGNVYKLKEKTLNFAWNTAKNSLFKNADICCFFNDDIELNKYYFENIKDIFSTQPFIRALVPEIVPEIKNEKSGKLVPVRKRQGCCFAIRKRLLVLLPDIPESLVTFFGDDFWFLYSNKLGVKWYKDAGNYITHKIGVAVKKTGVRPTLEPERIIFNKIRAEYEL